MRVWGDSETIDSLPWAPAAGARLAAAALVKRRFPVLGKALQAGRVIPLELSLGALDGVIGWGGRIQASLARRYAAARGVRYWSVEDGFLRSVGLGKARHQPLSIVVDDLGLHHDPRRSNRLEQLIGRQWAASELDHARRIRMRLVEEQLTKYNCRQDGGLKLPRVTKARRILLVDQVAGDASIAGFGAKAFGRMWCDALDQDAEILLRDHPDVLAGFASGVLRMIARTSGKAVLDGGGAIDEVLQEVDEVWTVSSQFGFEALLRGKPVVSYGMPFYAGWGLTEDRASDPASAAARERRMPAAGGIDQIVAAALVRYPIYFDPIQDRRVGIETAIDRLCAWRREAGRFGGRYVCVGFSRHKHNTARLFLDAPRSDVSFANAVPAVAGKAGPEPEIVVWGSSERLDPGRSRLTIEDGFIRSSGLGSDLVRPRSLCIDPVGIYYDATRPSRLEQILNDTVFADALLQRARRLRRLIVVANISKYNLPSERFEVSSLNTERPVALVAEQLPDDASLRFGRAVHDSSLALLASVRKARPDHFILFKRHPDILSGARRGGVSALDYCKHADYVLDRKVDIAWAGIDECHSATSQLGFEALLRGVKTYCHGAPFYSGWGLTVDSVGVERRRRKLSVDELVAGVLLLYPSYRCWKSRLPCEPEDVIRDLIRERDGRPGDRADPGRIAS